MRARSGGFRRASVQSHRLTGGAGTALRAEQHHRPGQLGLGHEATEDKHLREITALIDPRQFELITKPDSGLVVIQGGAGSGKTTIGLHRLAYLAFRDSRRFRRERMLVVVFNDALVRYIAEVLPALGVSGVVPRTYTSWASRTRLALYPRLPSRYDDDTPSAVTRLKKHPAMLEAVAAVVESHVRRAKNELETLLANEGDAGARAIAAFTAGNAKPLAHRAHALTAFIAGEAAKALSTNSRVAIERIAGRALAAARDVPGAWAELLTDGSPEEALRRKGARGVRPRRARAGTRLVCRALDRPRRRARYRARSPVASSKGPPTTTTTLRCGPASTDAPSTNARASIPRTTRCSCSYTSASAGRSPRAEARANPSCSSTSSSTKRRI